MSYLALPLSKEHDRCQFSCGKAPLDNYLQKQATQDMKRRLAVVFVIPDENSNRVKGFYTLSNDAVTRELIPVEVRRKMPPHYSYLPVTLLGRLAVDQVFQGQRIGEDLLLDALKRAYNLSKSAIGSMAVVVDPIDEAAISFYAAYGFVLLPDRNRLFIPMTTIGKLFC